VSAISKSTGMDRQEIIFKGMFGTNKEVEEERERVARIYVSPIQTYRVNIKIKGNFSYLIYFCIKIHVKVIITLLIEQLKTWTIN
jgi:hypothetical protein